MALSISFTQQLCTLKPYKAEADGTSVFRTLRSKAIFRIFQQFGWANTRIYYLCSPKHDIQIMMIVWNCEIRGFYLNAVHIFMSVYRRHIPQQFLMFYPATYWVSIRSGEHLKIQAEQKYNLCMYITLKYICNISLMTEWCIIVIL